MVPLLINSFRGNGFFAYQCRAFYTVLSVGKELKTFNIGFSIIASDALKSIVTKTMIAARITSRATQTAAFILIVFEASDLVC